LFQTLQAQAAVTQLEAALPGRIQSALLQAKSEWDAESQRQRVYELDLTRQRSLDEANRRASQVFGFSHFVFLYL
jgi:hypothetical protein